MWRTYLNKCVPIFLLISIIWSGLFISIEFNGLKKSRYLSFNLEYRVSDKMGITVNEHGLLVDDLINFIHGQKIDLHKWFSDKEVLHMQDVKDLYQVLRIGAVICFCVLVLCISYWIKHIDYHYKFWRMYKVALMCLGVFLMCLVISCLFNFEVIWHLFHRIFFRNDLWLLNPLEDRLIMLVPLEFFIKLVIDVGLVLVAWTSFFSFIVWRYRK